MNHYLHWLLPLFGLFLSAIAFGDGESGNTGTVKGTITIDGGPAAGIVVSIEGLPSEYIKSQVSNMMLKRAVIDQRDKKFIPRVLPVLVGTTVDFPNNDNTWHNVFSTSEIKKFDLGLYPPGDHRDVTFTKPGAVRILCNVHPHMEAYIVVKEHPSFDVSDSRGNYRLTAVPVGRYRLEVWHSELGTKVVPFRMDRV
ncbi:MAG: carboxypeptidase regulatory-like domain-containing protein, partial [Candidatus Binatia bacterium]